MSTFNIHAATFSKVSQHTEPKTVLSVVVPFFNEQEVLSEFHRRLAAVLDEMPERCEIVYVDDGSKDDSLMIAQNF
ncbi:glycosyltransferase, partial [Vibrio parahaemolyticus]|uniref:glycosyltransferase n=2 Tax=Vibrionaceae TaxID=641 RepID=UPI00155F2617